MTLAPIVIFCYKRVDSLEKTIDALSNNLLAADSDLIVFSDGPKTPADSIKVDQVRTYLKSIEGFKSVKIISHRENKGLANSIISGVSQVIYDYGKIIVVEDDLVTSPNFIKFMNDGLTKYGKDTKVFSISGYMPPIEIPASYTWDSFFALRSTSWGWATWRDRWEEVSWELDDFLEFSNNSQRVREFKAIGSNFFGLLKKQYEGKIDSWAIRFCYHQFKNKQYSVYPVISKVQNIGFGEGATHTTKQLSHFSTSLDTSTSSDFQFPDSKQGTDPVIIRNLKKHYSFSTRLFSKLKSFIQQ